MEEYPIIPMERTGRILRISIQTFLQNYQYFTIIAALFSLPFSASILLPQALVPSSSLLPRIHSRLHSLFDAAGFPPSSKFFAILNFKLPQAITSSVLVLPFTLSFFLIAKSCIIQSLKHPKPSHQPPFFSLFSLLNPLLQTQLCNSLVIFSANATFFSLLFVAFNFVDGFGLSSPRSILFLSVIGAIIYSIIFANSYIICNLALIVSGMENCGGYTAILKACILIRGENAVALSLAVFVNMALAAVEGLFQYRIVRSFHHSENPTISMTLEGILVAYLYSILIVLDTVTGCVFYKCCKAACHRDEAHRYLQRSEVQQELGNAFGSAKTVEENF